MEPRLQRFSSPYGELSGRLPSSAGLVERAHPGWRAALNELDPARRATWASCSGEDGLAFLERHRRGGWDFVLWDPYDFFERWSHAIPHLLALSETCPVLIYLYNKCPRGVGQVRQYKSLRQRIGDRPLCCGRLPSDGCLPRAFHEVLLLGAERVPAEVRARLADATRRWAAAIGEEGAFETSF